VSVAARSDKEASQTRDYCIAKNATLRRGPPRSFAAQKTLAQDDNQPEPPGRYFEPEIRALHGSIDNTLHVAATFECGRCGASAPVTAS